MVVIVISLPQISTAEPGKPSEVVNLRVSSHSESFIELAWKTPCDSGGGPIEVYRIYRDGKPLEIKYVRMDTLE